MWEINNNDKQTKNEQDKEQTDKVEKIYLNQGQYPNISHSKTAIGVLLFFLGIIGLIVGLLLYPYNTYERKTFIKGWVGALLSLIIIIILVLIISSIVSAVSR